jgi:hypothetical protein
VALHIAATVPTESATQTAGAVTVVAMAVTGSTTEAAAKVIAAKTVTTTITGRRGQMRWWKARNFRKQGQEQRWRCATLTTSLRCSPQIYERALLVTCPKLLLFAHHCRFSVERSAAFRLLASCASQKSGVLIAALAIIGICSGTERRFGMNKAAN